MKVCQKLIDSGKQESRLDGGWLVFGRMDSGEKLPGLRLHTAHLNQPP